MFAVFFVWFASVVERVSGFLGGTALACILLFAAWTLFIGMNNGIENRTDPYPIKRRWGKVMLAYAVITGAIWSIMPSEKTVYMMGGAYIGQEVIQSDTAAKVKKLLDSKLDQFLEEGAEKVSAKVEQKVEAVVNEVTGEKQ